jgi:hypothetical protein
MALNSARAAFNCRTLQDMRQYVQFYHKGSAKVAFYFSSKERRHKDTRQGHTLLSITHTDARPVSSHEATTPAVRAGDIASFGWSQVSKFAFNKKNKY